MFSAFPGSLNGGLDGLRAKIDFNLVRPGTGHRQHECGRVPKIALEGDRAGTLRQPAVQFVELEVDVAELLNELNSRLPSSLSLRLVSLNCVLISVPSSTGTYTYAMLGREIERTP